MKIFAVIHARFNSQRLPGKVLRKFCGQRMLEFQITRVKKSKLIDKIIIATTKSKKDNDIVNLATKNNVNVFRGSSRDLVGRVYNSVKQDKPDIIIRVSGDNPLIDPAIIDMVIKKMLTNKYDHISTFHKPKFPYGVGCAAFNFKTLENTYKKAKKITDREHIEPYMLKNKTVKTLFLTAPTKLTCPEISVTIDTEDEFQKVERCAKKLTKEIGKNFGVSEIINYFKTCKILVVANGKLGLELVKFLKKERESIVGLVLSEKDEYNLNNEIKYYSGLSENEILSTRTLRNNKSKRWILEKCPDLVLSLWSRFIFPKELIDKIPRGIINLHNSLLPLARGGEANIWTILKKYTPGVTIHYINEKIDQGPIITQTKIQCFEHDTGKSLYLRSEKALLKIFKENWKQIKFGKVKAIEQDGKGTYHKYRSSNCLREIKLNKNYKARDLIDLLRAFSFAPFSGSYFYNKKGEKVYLEIKLKKQKNDTQKKN